MTASTSIVAFLKGTKELIGVLGVLADVLAFYVKFPSKYAIPLGLVGSAFIVLWGFFARKSLSNLLKTIAWLGLIVGVAGVIFFTIVGVLILLRDSSSQGYVVADEVRVFDLNSPKLTNQLAGQYSIEIKHEVALVEILIIPAPEDLERVKDVDILTEGPLDQTNKMTLVINRTLSTQTYYQITNPSKNFNVKLNSTIELKQASFAPKIRMRVFYKYINRDWLWEVRSWIFRKLGW